MSTLNRRLAVVAACLVGLLVAGHALRSRLGIDFELDADGVRDLTMGLGPAAPLLFVFVVAARTLLWLPSPVVLLAAGLCFGTGLGAVVGGTGLMLSGVLLFGVARYAGRDTIERRVGRRGRKLLELASQRRGAIALALAAGHPLTPLSPLQASAGLTAMPLATFIPAALVGGTLRASTYAFFGDAMVELEGRQLALAVALVLGVVALPLALPSGRRWLRELVSPSSAPPPDRAGDSGPSRP